jgi:hypothetical protein
MLSMVHPTVSLLHAPPASASLLAGGERLAAHVSDSRAGAGGKCSDISVERGREALARGDASRAVRYADAARRLDAENIKAQDLMREALGEEKRASAKGSSWPNPAVGNEVFFSQVKKLGFLPAWRHVNPPKCLVNHSSPRIISYSDPPS